MQGSTNALTSVVHTRKMSACRSDRLQPGKNLKHALCRKPYGHKANMWWAGLINNNVWTTQHKRRGYASLYVTVGGKGHVLLDGHFHSERRRDNISLIECAQLKIILSQFSTWERRQIQSPKRCVVRMLYHNRYNE